MNNKFKILYYCFVSVLIAFGVLLVMSYFGISGVTVKIVQSGSMEPAIRVGSIVVLKPVENYDVGDVVTFGENTRDKTPTTHRIVDERISSGQAVYKTKGDANSDVDQEEVGESSIIGKVIFSIPVLGYILDFARKPVGFMLIVGIPAGLIVFDEVFNIWKELGKMKSSRRFIEKDEEDQAN